MSEHGGYAADPSEAEFEADWFDGSVETLFEGTVAAIGSQAADCCAARSAFRVVLPPSAERNMVAQLFLCGEHYRNARRSLLIAGTAVFDSVGRTVEPGRLGADRTPSRV